MSARFPIAVLSAVLTSSLGIACDEPVQAIEASEATPTPVQAEATVRAAGNIDLQAVVDVVASGQVDDATALEKRLAADATARVDLDGDGERDVLRIVEERGRNETVFEIRAVPSSTAKIDVALAPPIATLTIEARPRDGHAIARASYTPSFAATAGLDAHASVEHTFTGIAVETEGRLRVEASANVFVAWTFRVGRPVYVAEVFIVEHHGSHDPCWPPGHCKHGHWKAERHGDRHHGDDTALVRVFVDGGHGHGKPKHKPGKHGGGHKGHKKHR